MLVIVVQRVKNLELLQWAVLGLSATGVAYAILGLSAAYLALVAAKEANRWAYYMYELALMAVRLQLMQLCAGTVPVRLSPGFPFFPFPPTFFGFRQPRTPWRLPPFPCIPSASSAFSPASRHHDSLLMPLVSLLI
jgi:hypothetical protein